MGFNSVPMSASLRSVVLSISTPRQASKGLSDLQNSACATRARSSRSRASSRRFADGFFIIAAPSPLLLSAGRARIGLIASIVGVDDFLYCNLRLRVLGMDRSHVERALCLIQMVGHPLEPPAPEQGPLIRYVFLGSFPNDPSQGDLLLVRDFLKRSINVGRKTNRGANSRHDWPPCVILSRLLVVHCRLRSQFTTLHHFGAG